MNSDGIIIESTTIPYEIETHEEEWQWTYKKNTNENIN